MGEWNRVLNHESRVMPDKDGKVWVTRTNCFDEVGVQTIDYYVDEERFTWDGIRAWMPYQEEQPMPYDYSNYFAGKPRKYKDVSKSQEN